jgi:hypothetical protein
MLKALALARPEFEEILAGFRQTEIGMGTTSSNLCVEVVLSVIFPKHTGHISKRLCL